MPEEVAGIHSELASVSHAELELPAALVELVMMDGYAVVEPDRADGQVQPQTGAVVVVEIIKTPVPGIGGDTADVVKHGETNTDAALLLKNRNAVFRGTEPISVAADGLLEEVILVRRVGIVP